MLFEEEPIMKNSANHARAICIHVRRTASLMTMMTIIPFLISFAQGGWQLRSSGTIQNLLSLDFRDLVTGVVVGDSNVILSTTDSGRTWAVQTSEPSLCLKDIDLIDSLNACAIGHNYIQAFPTIVSTVNGGQNWNMVLQDTMAGYFSIRMFSVNRGIISARTGFYSPWILRTRDGWQTVERNTFSFYHYDDGHTDEGRPFDMEFPDTSIGFIAGGIWDGDGAVVRSTDGGVSWATIFWCDYILWGAACPSIDTVFVVGVSGMIYRSTDMGDTWVNQRSATLDTLYAVSFFDNMTGLAVGQGGTIVGTTDGGQNWNLQESGTSVTLRGVEMLSPDVAYVVGNSGTVLYTNTGGWPPTGCDYVAGDINGDGSANGIDVVYGVSYLKGGGAPRVDCGAPVGPCPQASPFYAAGDVNGGCSFNGVDITYFVAYLKGLQPMIQWCEDCPPVQGR